MTEQRHPLERLLLPLASPKLDEAPTRAASPVWLRADRWSVFARPGLKVGANGVAIERFLQPDGRVLAAVWDGESGTTFVPFSLAEAHANLVSESWRVDGHRKWELTPRQFDFFYRVKRFIPRKTQLAARRMLIRRAGLPAFPRWPLDESLTRLLEFYARCVLLTTGADQASFRWFWPEGRQAAVVLTHDVETEQGLRLALELADLEEARGFRSSFNIVADWYPIDAGILRELRARGFELGVHGVHHDRSMFSSREAFENQKPAVRAAADLFEAQGFRSPATHRVFDWLGELPVAYDCSIPHSDPFEPQPGGCCSLWPFFIGDLVELPYTLPQDHTLFTLLGHRSADLWLRLVGELKKRSGLIQSVTHPDPGYLGDADKRALYLDFLDALKHHDDLWITLPREVARWWRLRDASPDDKRVGLGVIRRTGEHEVALQPLIERRHLRADVQA